MIEKLDIIIKAINIDNPDGRLHGNSTAELTVSVIDVVNKLNEVIDYINVRSPLRSL